MEQAVVCVRVHVSSREPNRLMLCGETVAVCCENRTEHTDTLCWQVVRRVTTGLGRGGSGYSSGQVLWDLWSRKWYCGRFDPSAWVLLTSCHCTDRAALTQSRYRSPNNGRCTGRCLSPLQMALFSCRGVDDVYCKTVSYCARFEVFTAVTMKNGVFWDVTPCGSCENRRFEGT
jgi:hypothetical protein